MAPSDSVVGRILVSSALLAYSYLVTWLLILPFTQLRQDHWLYKGFPGPEIALMVPALPGLTFIGSLVLFTVYHIHSYLH